MVLFSNVLELLPGAGLPAKYYTFQHRLLLDSGQQGARVSNCPVASSLKIP